MQASGPGCQGCSPPVAMATAPRRHYLPPAPTARSSNLRAASRACAPPPAPSPPPGGSEHAQWPRPGCVRRGPLEGGRGLRGGVMAAGASGRPRASRQPPAALPQPPAAGGAGTGGPLVGEPWDETGWRESGGLEKKSSEKKGEKRRGKIKNKMY